MAEILLHAGTHKTASSTIQAILETKEIQAEIITYQRYRKSQFDNSWRQGFNDSSAEAFCDEFVSGSRLILSDERLLGEPAGQPELYAKSTDLARLIAGLQELGHQVKPLIVIRNPFDFFTSWYLQIISSGRMNCSFLEFFERSKVSEFRYSQIVDRLETAAPTTVIPYELLLVDQESFAQKLNGWLQEDVFSASDFAMVRNRSLSAEAFRLIRSIGDVDRETRVKVAAIAKREIKGARQLDLTSPSMERFLRAAFWRQNSDFIETHIQDPRIRDIWKGDARL